MIYGCIVLYTIVIVKVILVIVESIVTSWKVGKRMKTVQEYVKHDM